MKVAFRVLLAAGCLAFLSLSCGFAPNPSQSLSTDIIVTAAPSYEPLAALRGGERFPAGAKLLLIHNGTVSPLVPDFAATADARVSFDGATVLFSGKRSISDPWQIYEIALADRSIRQVVHSATDAIRPLYLPGWRVVYAQKNAEHFQMISTRLVDSKALDEIEGKGAQASFPISFTSASAIPADVLADGRIVFESQFPLEDGSAPELFVVYSDGSGVESYRCDHSWAARWSARQLRSGDIVFTHGSSLSRFTSALAHEEPIAAPPADYSGAVVETTSGEWLVSARESAKAAFTLRIWKPGSPAMRTFIAQTGVNLIDPVLVSARNRPRRHPSALHDWDSGNLLALDVRVSRDGSMQSTPVTVRLETRDSSGHSIAMGTAPVESDGSFFVKTPADRAIRFVLLNARGEVVRQEHGWFWARRGEQRICVGCHAGPEHAAENRVPQVLLQSTTPVDLTGTASQPEKGGN